MEHWVSIPTEKKIHIDLVPRAIAKHARPYPVHVIHISAFKKELLHLVKIGIFLPQGATPKRWQSLLG